VQDDCVLSNCECVRRQVATRAGGPDRDDQTGRTLIELEARNSERIDKTKFNFQNEFAFARALYRWSKRSRLDRRDFRRNGKIVGDDFRRRHLRRRPDAPLGRNQDQSDDQ
jgi:hypothetical protein